MNIDDAYKLYEQLYEEHEKVPIQHNVCNVCKVEMIIDTCFVACPKCGLTEEPAKVLSYSRMSFSRSKQSLYFRRSYFVERLNLIAGFKQIVDYASFKPYLDEIKQHKFKTIRELKKVMKSIKGCHRYYKHIYNIYFDIKGKRLIELTRSNITRLSAEFIVLETCFKSNLELHSRKNMFSYSAIIYMILKRNKIRGYKNVLLPSSPMKVMAKIKEFCKP
jgi:hypothetical protein